MFAVLNELLPRKARLVIYVLFALTGVVIAAWQAAEGDWLTFAASIATTLVGWLAAANVTPPAEEVIARADTRLLEAEAHERGEVLINALEYDDLQAARNQQLVLPVVIDPPYDR